MHCKMGTRFQAESSSKIQPLVKGRCIIPQTLHITHLIFVSNSDMEKILTSSSKSSSLALKYIMLCSYSDYITTQYIDSVSKLQ